MMNGFRLFLSVAPLAALSLNACDAPSPEPQKTSGTETFNERIERQKRYVPAIGRSILPAPEGEAREVAFAALKEAELPCPKVTEAERMDSDGTIIANCGERDFRIFKIEGTATAMPLDCKVGRDTFGVDACDKAKAATRDDNTVGLILERLAQK